MPEEKHYVDIGEDEYVVLEVKDPDKGRNENGVPYSRHTYVNGSTGRFRLMFEEVEEDE